MVIYHLVPKRYYERNPRTDYYPKPFAKEGFIHCTENANEMARIANHFYKQERGPHVYLYIETQRVHAKITYNDPGRRYPHINGGLNRDAIIAVKPAVRLKGKFQPPQALPSRS